jgi:hypothetical protein
MPMRALMLALLALLAQRAACFLQPAALVGVGAAGRFPVRASMRHPAAPCTRPLPAVALSAAAGKDGKNEERQEPFEVTWEHEDGTKDTTVAQPLTSSAGTPVKLDSAEGGSSTVAGRVKAFFGKLFGGAKMDRQKLTALGASALLSYGFVSNLSHLTCLIIAWCVHGKKTGLSPLDPGQWPAFLAVYAIFFAFQNVIRPLRFAVSVALSPFFDRLVENIQKRGSALSGRSLNKPTSFGITVFLVNVLGSFSYLFGGLFLATTVLRVPLLRTVTGV